MSTRFKAILFDKDGTLFDFASTWESWAGAFLKRLGDNSDHAHDMAQAIGFDLTIQHFAPSSVVIAGTPWEVAEALSPFLPSMSILEIVDLLNEEAARAPQAEAVPLVPFLDDLRASGYRLGVATNDAEAPARAHLGASGITEHFDFIAGFDSGHGGKPAPGQLIAFARAMGLQPEDCVMVGDSRHDLGAGRAAGFTTVGVLTGFASRADLADLADVILPDIGHLTAWLAQPQPAKIKGPGA